MPKSLDWVVFKTTGVTIKVNHTIFQSNQRIKSVWKIDYYIKTRIHRQTITMYI